MSPRPNHKMAMGIQARGGTGRSSSTTGLTRFRSRADQPMASPRGTANTQATAKPVPTRIRLYAR